MAPTEHISPSEVIKDHWRYGRWASLTAIAMWISGNIYYALLPTRYGLESAALLRALMNLMYPLLHAASALILLLIPVLVRQRTASGLGIVKWTAVKLIRWILPLGVIYLFLLVHFREPLLQLCYGGRYSCASEWTMLAIGALPVTGSIAGLIGAVLRSLERTDLILRSYLASTVGAVSVGVPVTLRYGVPGAAAALVLGDSITVIVLTACMIYCRESAGDER